MKPTLALTHLNRREPIVYFGCTWTEIKACVWRGAALALPVTVVLMAMSPLPVLMVVPGLFVWLVATRMFLNHIHRNRAGRPLFYERHRKGVRHPAFIRADTVHQYGRNATRKPAPRDPRVARPS